ncbi:MAG: glycosyltransferase [Pseudomonadota bacterium]
MIALATILALAAWAALLLAHHGFWRADQRLVEAPAPPVWPEIVAVIPARDEAATIAEVLGALSASTYPGRLRVIVVDDASTDATPVLVAEAARAGARPIHLVAGQALRPGWSGKLNALDTGIEAAVRLAPGARYLLLTDADIRHAPDTATRLVALAEARGLALVSLMARLDARGVWGRLLIPAFVFFFQKLYPFGAVNTPKSRIAGAAGGCILLSRQALEETGGIAAMASALIDDCTLAARIKTGPPRRAIWLALAREEAVSLRDNRALSSIWTMVARTAFTQLRHSGLMLAGSVAGMVLVYLAGPLAVLSWPWHGQAVAAGCGALAWGLSTLAYRPTLALWGFHPAWALTLPLAALLYTAMTLDSARRHWFGRGAVWKGRSYGRDAG